MTSNRNSHRRPPQKKLTKFERETERRRREMLGNIAGRVVKPSQKALKRPLWTSAPASALKVMREKPQRRGREGQR